MSSPPQPSNSGWAALFLAANSPGQVIRFLQRRQRSLTTPQSAMLLSDAAGPHRLRALLFESDAGKPRASLEAIAPALATALATPLTLLYLTPSPDARWGATLWNADGSETERTETAYTPPTPLGFLARLRGQTVSSPLIEWAHAHSLPIDRLPPLRPAGALSVIDYETVAALDRKSLLVENSPRLYRFGVVFS